MIQLNVTGIKEIETLAGQTSGCISLSQGVLRAGGIPSEIKSYLQNDILNSDKADYYENPSLAYGLKVKISNLLEKKYSSKIPTDQIMLTHGCIGGISVLLLSLLDVGDEVIIPEPTYPVYQNIVLLAKGKPVFVSCLEENNNEKFSWKLEIERIKKAKTSKTKAIIFSNPQNPLGFVVPKEVLEDLVNWCESNGVYLIIDEVYEDYIFEGPFYSAVSFIPSSKFVIRSSSFSKNFAMSGWRVGYVIIPSHLTNIFSISQHSMLVSTSQLGIAAADFALNHPELLNKFQSLVKSNLEICEELLKPLVDRGLVGYQKPKAGFFLFLGSLNNIDVSKECLNMISKAGVALIPGNRFGASGNNFLRLCFARNREVLVEGVTRFVNYWTKLNA